MEAGLAAQAARVPRALALVILVVRRMGARRTAMPATPGLQRQTLAKEAFIQVGRCRAEREASRREEPGHPAEPPAPAVLAQAAQVQARAA